MSLREISSIRDDLIREVASRLSDLPDRCQDLWKKILEG